MLQQDKLEIISRNSLLDFYKIEKSFIHLCSIQWYMFLWQKSTKHYLGDY
jgi:hypothetical protein